MNDRFLSLPITGISANPASTSFRIEPDCLHFFLPVSHVVSHEWDLDSYHPYAMAKHVYETFWSKKIQKWLTFSTELAFRLLVTSPINPNPSPRPSLPLVSVWLGPTPGHHFFGEVHIRPLDKQLPFYDGRIFFSPQTFSSLLRERYSVIVRSSSGKIAYVDDYLSFGEVAKKFREGCILLPVATTLGIVKLLWNDFRWTQAGISVPGTMRVHSV